MKTILISMIMMAMCCLSSQAQTEQQQQLIQDLSEVMKSGNQILPISIGDIGQIEKFSKDDKNAIIEFTLLQYSEYISYIDQNPDMVKDYLWQTLPLLKEKVKGGVRYIPDAPEFGLKLIISNSDKTATATVELKPEELQRYIQELKK